MRWITRADVVFLGVRMPDGDGLTALGRIKLDKPDLPVLMLSAFDNPAYIARAVALGANAKLAAVVETSPTVPAWHDAWMALGPESTEAGRLTVYQAVRDSGCLPAEAGFYLVSWQIDAMASQDAEMAASTTWTSG